MEARDLRCIEWSLISVTDGRSRRKAPVADRGLGRLNWADTTPTVVASGTPAIDVERTSRVATVVSSK